MSEDGIQAMRDNDAPNHIIDQKGAQERMLACDVDIMIGGGSRGGSKTFTLLLEALYDVNNPFFRSILLRAEKPDLADMIQTSYEIYDKFGKFNKSQNDLTWNFNKGGFLKFWYYEESFDEFKKNFQGKQFAYIGIDEITHCPFNKFKYLITNNRNAYGIRNRFRGMCNPDPDSWVRVFIDWWIGDDGLPIPERDGVVRYCYMKGETPEEIIWGDTPQEVYEQCSDEIDKLWRPEYDALGFNKVTMFVKSVTFLRAGLEENIKLLKSDPAYLANLAGQGEAQQARDLLGNWNWKIVGDDMIKMTDMELFFNNPQSETKGQKTASCDVAFQGGDNLILWNFIGNHIDDLLVLRNDSKTVITAVKEKLREWGVEECNFTYDVNGLGQSFKGFFPDAVPFNNMGAPIAASPKEEKGIKAIYHDLKSQCAWLLYKDFKEGNMSINPRLLTQTYSGHGFKNLPLKQILMNQRKCIRRKDDTDDNGFCLINKKEMKMIVGCSPDFFEGLIYNKIFSIIKIHKKTKGLWMI